MPRTNEYQQLPLGVSQEQYPTQNSFSPPFPPQQFASGGSEFGQSPRGGERSSRSSTGRFATNTAVGPAGPNFSGSENAPAFSYDANLRNDRSQLGSNRPHSYPKHEPGNTDATRQNPYAHHYRPNSDPNLTSHNNQSAALHGVRPSRSNNPSSSSGAGSSHYGPGALPSLLESSEMVYIPDAAETIQIEMFLRSALGIPDGQAINLWNISNDRLTALDLKFLTAAAIWGYESRKITLAQIYQELEERWRVIPGVVPEDLGEDKHLAKDRFQFFPRQKRDSIRHLLSLKTMFRRVERSPTEKGRGGYWYIDLRDGDTDKRERKRGKKGTPNQDEVSESLDELDMESLSIKTELSPTHYHYYLGERAAIRRTARDSLASSPYPPTTSHSETAESFAQEQSHRHRRLAPAPPTSVPPGQPAWVNDTMPAYSGAILAGEPVFQHRPSSSQQVPDQSSRANIPRRDQPHQYKLDSTSTSQGMQYLPGHPMHISPGEGQQNPQGVAFWPSAQSGAEVEEQRKGKGNFVQPRYR